MYHYTITGNQTINNIDSNRDVPALFFGIAYRTGVASFGVASFGVCRRLHRLPARVIPHPLALTEIKMPNNTLCSFLLMDSGTIT